MWQPATPTRETMYRFGIISLVLALSVGAGLAGASMVTQAQADVTSDGLSVANTNKTVGSSVSDVTLATTARYQYDVPDAERRIVKLRVGPTEDNLETVTFAMDSDPPGSDSGTVELSGSILQHPAFSASQFTPGVANSTTTDVVVQVVIEVDRAGGETVRKTTTETATITLHDDATLSAEVGGDAAFTVATE